jgi:hypothetical protein
MYPYGFGYAPLKIVISPLYRIEEFAPEGSPNSPTGLAILCPYRRRIFAPTEIGKSH